MVDLNRALGFSTFTLFYWVTLLIAFGSPVWPDSAGGRETLALQACLADHEGAEHLCFYVPFYTCMGEQLMIAANPALAEERCLFQEQFVWRALLDEACADLTSITAFVNFDWEAICRSPNGFHLEEIATEMADANLGPNTSNLSLRLSIEDVRSHSIRLRMLLAAASAAN